MPLKLTQVVTGSVIYVDGALVEFPLESVTLPTLKNKMTEAGGLAAGYQAPGLLEAIQGLSVTTQGVSPKIQEKIGVFETIATYRLVFAYVSQGEKAKAYEVQFRGIPSVDGRTVTSGQGNNHAYAFGCIEQYKETVDGAVTCDINIKTGKAVMGGGNDIFASTKAALGI